MRVASSFANAKSAQETGRGRGRGTGRETRSPGYGNPGNSLWQWRCEGRAWATGSVRDRWGPGRLVTFQAGHLGEATLLSRHSWEGQPGEVAAESGNPQPWNRKGPRLRPSLYPGPSTGPAPRQAMKSVGSREEGEEENARRERPGEAGSVRRPGGRRGTRGGQSREMARDERAASRTQDSVPGVPRFGREM